jgi:hypothetical protein
MILVQDNNFDKLKDKAIELKNKVVKKWLYPYSV